MTKEDIDRLRKDLDKKFANYVTAVETDNTKGISTSKNLYLAALIEWEKGWRIYSVQRDRK
ncbi:MAG: hypothetical protein ACJ749_13185 [Flavisolibacter sp.]